MQSELSTVLKWNVFRVSIAEYVIVISVRPSCSLGGLISASPSALRASSPTFTLEPEEVTWPEPSCVIDQNFFINISITPTIMIVHCTSIIYNLCIKYWYSLNIFFLFFSIYCCLQVFVSACKACKVFVSACTARRGPIEYYTAIVIVECIRRKEVLN